MAKRNNEKKATAQRKNRSLYTRNMPENIRITKRKETKKMNELKELAGDIKEFAKMLANKGPRNKEGYKKMKFNYGVTYLKLENNKKAKKLGSIASYANNQWGPGDKTLQETAEVVRKVIEAHINRTSEINEVEFHTGDLIEFNIEHDGTILIPTPVPWTEVQGSEMKGWQLDYLFIRNDNNQWWQYQADLQFNEPYYGDNY